MTMFKFLLAKQANDNGGFNLIAGGITTSSTLTSTTDRYVIANDAVSAGPAITAKYIYCAFTNKVNCLFAGGGNFTSTSTVDKYSIANNTFSPGTSMPGSSIDACGWGNETTGLATGGGASFTAVYKFAWSGETWSFGTSLSSGKWGHSSIGTTSRAIFCGGATSYAASVNSACIEYLVNTDIVSSTTSLSTARGQSYGHSSKITGYVAGGSNFSINFSNVEAFLFSNNSVTAGTSLSLNRRAPASAGNNLSAIISSGSSTVNDAGGVATCEKYMYSTNIVTGGTNISVAKSGASSICSNPGHL